jgi:hypothetical protein
MALIFRGTDWVDTTTDVSAAAMEPSIDQIEIAVAKLANHSFAVAQGFITQNGTTVEWPIIDVFYHKDDGNTIRGRLLAGTGALSNGNAHYVTLNDIDGSTALAASVVDMDAMATTLADRTKLILWCRSSMGSGTGLLHYVGLMPQQPLRGSGTLTAGASTTVSFPTGYATMPSVRYQVILTPTSTGWYAAVPHITGKAINQFVITTTGAAGTETFDWMVIGN